MTEGTAGHQTFHQKLDALKSALVALSQRAEAVLDLQT